LTGLTNEEGFFLIHKQAPNVGVVTQLSDVQ
jgi:hypothetical protein